MNVQRCILLLAIGTVLSACGDAAASTQMSRPSQTTLATAAPTASAAPPPTLTTTSTTSSSTTSSSTSSVAVIDETGELAGVDWPAIVQILGRRRQALYASPVDEPAAYDAICAAGDNSCRTALATQIASLVDQGLRITNAAPYTVRADDEVLENVEGGHGVDTARIVTVVVTIQGSPSNGQLVDINGAVQADLASDTSPGQNLRSRVTLVRTAAGGEWRILEQSSAGTVDS